MSLAGTLFDVDLDTIECGIGTLFIADESLVLQDPRILRLGNDMGRFTTHIMSASTPSMSSMLLDRVLHDFVNAACYDLWCDAYVDFMIDDMVVLTKEYGFADGSYTMRIKVHGRGIRGGQNGFFDIFGQLLDEATPDEPLISIDTGSSGGLEIYKITGR